MNAKATVRVWHWAKAWRDTAERDVIPYEGALSLSID
jgi:hypothetical protein